MMATTWTDRWKNAFIYALATTTMILLVFTVLSILLGQAQRDLADRVDRNARVTEQRTQETQTLLCALFRGAEDPQIHAAWEAHCAVPVPETTP